VPKWLVLVTGGQFICQPLDVLADLCNEGASGIGSELTAQLIAKGSYHGLMRARSEQKGNWALQELPSQNLPGSVEILLLDVTKDNTIKSAALKVRKNHDKLDILVNNAAVASLESNMRNQMRLAFGTNTSGPLIVATAFVLLLQESIASPRIVSITSGAGSISCRLSRGLPTYNLQGYQYRASKAAENMVTACQSVEYESAGIKVLLYDPGFRQSNLGPYNSVANGSGHPFKSVISLIDIFDGKRDHEEGKLLHNIAFYPW
jgi:NAD(P)-dependent dehydrogenase (short-subunit alcohol dehydrogenase family)